MPTFTRLGALDVVTPPLYVFLIGGLISPFSNCPLLIASSILIPQSHNSPKELLGDEKNLLCWKPILDNHVDMAFLIWPINHP